MNTDSWIHQSLGSERLQQAVEEAGRRRLQNALGISGSEMMPDGQLRFVMNALELRVYDLLDEEDTSKLRTAAAEVFQIARAIPLPEGPLQAAEWLVRIGCLGVLGDRGADVRRLLSDDTLPRVPLDSDNWGTRVWSNILDIWLRLFRKSGWDDLNLVQKRVIALRQDQQRYEPQFLASAEEQEDVRPAWELIMEYHLAKAAEVLGIYIAQGVVDNHYDIREQLEAQFDRAIAAAARAGIMDRESISRLLARTARALVDNSIWTVTRAVNSRVSEFVKALTSQERKNPIFEMLPPQRRTLREEGLLGSSHRSVVVSLPTSSGKTFIAQFRILQALNQFNHERGWVAYLAPTRSLVNQLALRLRRDFSDIRIVVEKVSPALEIDGLEAGILTDNNDDGQFRILVTTPEKLDLMLRGGWEEKIGRPLTLVVVDEAHGLASAQRGLKLELLLATINRECRHAQFLLLTPFIRNASEIAKWLDPNSNNDIELDIDWCPNDRVVAIAQVQKGEKPGDFSVRLSTQLTTRSTITVPEFVELRDRRPLGFSWSEVSQSASKLAAATAQALHHRGAVVVLVESPSASWKVAEYFSRPENYSKNPDLSLIKQFLTDEMGDSFPLGNLLDYGVAVHHAGLSDDTRVLVEWLTEHNKLHALVATTTIAQGVNYPISGVVFASHQYKMRKFPFRENMPSADFWNIAGRAGRVDQGDLGFVVLAAINDEKAEQVKEFIAQSVGELNSTLIELVQRAADAGKLLKLESLSSQPGWSAFLQYLAHTYRQIGNHERFASEVEQVLRGTLGFQSLRKSHKDWADSLVQGVYNYAERIKGKPLKLVDATGFSWESVSHALKRIDDADVSSDIWSPELFGKRREDLQRLLGILLQVPELRDPLKEVTGGTSPDGDMLSRIVCDWVQGRPLTEMATEYFSTADGDEDDDNDDSVAAMTRCCRIVFSRLTQTASWGLAALQSLTIGDKFDSLPSADQRMLRNLPARVYYGVNSDEAVALRMLGVPRAAAFSLAKTLRIGAGESLSEVRAKLKNAGIDQWVAAVGRKGQAYYRVWSIIEGEV